MPDTTRVAGAAQACAHTVDASFAEPDSAELALECDDAEVTSIAGKLRLIYAAGWCADTSRELGKRVGCHPRTVRKANVLIRDTYGARFIEEPVRIGDTRAVSAVARRIVPETGPGVRPHSPIFSDLVICVRVGSLVLKAITDGARAPAPRELPQRPKRRTRKRRERLQRLAPLALEVGVPRLIATRHTLAGWYAVRDVLTEPDYHAHPDEARRAARELANSAADEPAALFRALFAKAKKGFLFGEERRDDAKRVRLAELEERKRDPDFDPGTTSPGRGPPFSRQKPPIATRAGSTRVEPTGPPRTADPNAGARFLEQMARRREALGVVFEAELGDHEIPF